MVDVTSTRYANKAFLATSSEKTFQFACPRGQTSSAKILAGNHENVSGTNMSLNCVSCPKEYCFGVITNELEGSNLVCFANGGKRARLLVGLVN